MMNEHKKGTRAVKYNAKPRNFVAKNAGATTSGAGAHKDKKKAMKQGDVKHKKDYTSTLESKLQEAVESSFCRICGCSPCNCTHIVAEGVDTVVQRILSEGRLGDFLPPFRANGLSIDDRRGNSVAQVVGHGSLAKEVADALNQYVSKKGVADKLSENFGQQVTQAVKDIKLQNPKLSREEFLEHLWDYLDAEYGNQFANKVLNYEDKLWAVYASGVDESDDSMDAVEAWKQEVLRTYPNLSGKIKFKGRGTQINAEIPGLDRSFGVFDLGTGDGEVLRESYYTQLAEKLYQALKKINQMC